MIAPAIKATLKIKVCLPPASIAIRRFAALCNTPVPPSRPLCCGCGLRFGGLGKGGFSNLLPPLCGAETGAFNDKNLYKSSPRLRRGGGGFPRGRVNYEAPLGSPLCLLSWRNKKVGSCCGARHLRRRRCAFLICRPLPLAQLALSAAGSARFAPPPQAIFCTEELLRSVVAKKFWMQDDTQF